MTNYHIAVDAIQAVSIPQKDYFKKGFSGSQPSWRDYAARPAPLNCFAIYFWRCTAYSRMT
ncbi:MAG: hypothetical protein ACPLZD_00180 [Candidatus Saccharicenans sp.]